MRLGLINPGEPQIRATAEFDSQVLYHGRIAQVAEPTTDNREVGVSITSSSTIFGLQA